MIPAITLLPISSAFFKNEFITKIQLPKFLLSISRSSE